MGYDRPMSVSKIRKACLSVAGAAVLMAAALVLPSASRAADAPLPAAFLTPGHAFAPHVAPPTASQIAGARLLRAGHSRKVKVKTSDRAPGGLLEADVTWSGSGPYHGKVYGSIQDREADGYCVGAWVFNGTSGVYPSLSQEYACPKGEIQSAHYSYKKRWRVLVEVCLVKHNVSYYCSDWK